nr:PLP-dependent transferase [Haladaptatus sp. R4]
MSRLPSRVYYSGLENHLQHELVSNNMSGYCGIFSFEFDGTIVELEAFIEGLEVFTLGESWWNGEFD